MSSLIGSARFGDSVAKWIVAVTESKGEPGPHVPPAGPGGRELLGLGLAIAVAVLVPLFVGLGIDAIVHSSPIGLLLGLALGVTLASVTVFQQFRRYL